MKFGSDSGMVRGETPSLAQVKGWDTAEVVWSLSRQQEPSVKTGVWEEN